MNGFPIFTFTFPNLGNVFPRGIILNKPSIFTGNNAVFIFRDRSPIPSMNWCISPSSVLSPSGKMIIEKPSSRRCALNLRLFSSPNSLPAGNVLNKCLTEKLVNLVFRSFASLLKKSGRAMAAYFVFMQDANTGMSRVEVWLLTMMPWKVVFSHFILQKIFVRMAAMDFPMKPPPTLLATMKSQRFL